LLQLARWAVALHQPCTQRLGVWVLVIGLCAVFTGSAQQYVGHYAHGA
jgi:hypothetical protein